MLAAMPARIFEEWLLYHREEPFGQLPYRIGYASAMVSTLLAKPRGRRAWEPADFMPDERRSLPAPTPDQNLRKMVGFAMMFGAEIQDPEGKLKGMLGG